MDTNDEALGYAELSEEELEFWRPQVRKSLSDTYCERIRQLNATRTFPNTDEGWEHLRAQAWTEALATDEACRSVRAISAQRRMERALSEGTLATAVISRTVTVEEMKALMRSAQPDGELRHFDGSPVEAGQIEELVAILNDPEKRAQAFESYSFSYEDRKEIAQMAGNVLPRLRPPSRVADASNTFSPSAPLAMAIPAMFVGNRFH